MIKIRLHGEEEEIKKTIEILQSSFELLEVSKLYADRGSSKYARCYIDAKQQDNQ